MREIIALAVGFLLIVVMLFKKVHIGTTMLTASAVMGLLAGFGFLKTLILFFTSMTERATIELLAVVTLICILSYLLQKYGILDKMADSLEELFNNNRFSIMLMPMLIGVLFIPGGAVMSAPVVDSLGDKLEFSNVRKSAINLIFRHALFFVFPFSTTMVLASQITGLSPYAIIKYTFPMALMALASGYVFYIRDSTAGKEAMECRPDKNVLNRIGAVLWYTSPLWVGILINLISGIPLYLALVPGVFIVYFMSQKGKKDFLRDMVGGIKWSMLYAVAGIMVLQGFIKQMPALVKAINTLLETGMDVRILIVLSTAVLGLLTANNTAVTGMLLPLFLPLADGSHEKALLTSLIFVSGVIFYFISPLHLCQVFTAEYFNIKVKELYKEYRVFWSLLVLTMIILYVFVY